MCERNRDIGGSSNSSSRSRRDTFVVRGLDGSAEGQGGEGWGADDGEPEEEVCSEDYLLRITREETLDAVHNLILTVDTNVTQVRLHVHQVSEGCRGFVLQNVVPRKVRSSKPCGIKYR